MKSIINEKNIERFSWGELRSYAKDIGLENIPGYKKPELIEAIKSKIGASPSRRLYQDMHVPQGAEALTAIPLAKLRLMGMSIGIKNIVRFKKVDLVDAIVRIQQGDTSLLEAQNSSTRKIGRPKKLDNSKKIKEDKKVEVIAETPIAAAVDSVEAFEELEEFEELEILEAFEDSRKQKDLKDLKTLDGSKDLVEFENLESFEENSEDLNIEVISVVIPAPAPIDDLTSPAIINPVDENTKEDKESLKSFREPSHEPIARPVIKKPSFLVELDSGIERRGILELIHDTDYGFLRVEGFLPSSNDVYVSPSLIRRFNLKTGDHLVGNLRLPKDNEKFRSLLYLTSVNGDDERSAQRRRNFEDLRPIFPRERLTLESDPKDLATRMIDLIAPIGFGQRGMIVAPPKAGKTVLIKKIAKSILTNYENVHLIVLLIDERPEEVTDIQDYISNESVDIVYSTFDEQPENHKRSAEMVLERAKRLVEHGRDVVILMDSITRLARAYNITMPSGGRALSGGLDPAALYMPKKFFGAARNIEKGGSLTILATALVDTGSKMDDVIFEEFKGTGNMELVLDRRLSEKRIFPAIDINRSGTRKEEMLLSDDELKALLSLRRRVGNVTNQEFYEQIKDMLKKTPKNSQFVNTILAMRS